MIINLRTLPAQGLTLQGEAEPEIIDLDEPGLTFASPIAYHLQVNRAGKMLVVRGELETSVGLLCAACLKGFDYRLRIPDFHRELEIAGQETIDLTGEVREDIILTLPVKPLCRADCRGLCPFCGEDLNQERCACAAPTSDSPFARLNWSQLKPI